MAHRLRLIRSPIVKGEKDAHSDSSSILNRSLEQPHIQTQDVQDLGYRDGPDHDCPEFEKHEEATASEVCLPYYLL